MGRICHPISHWLTSSKFFSVASWVESVIQSFTGLFFSSHHTFTILTVQHLYIPFLPPSKLYRFRRDTSVQATSSGSILYASDNKSVKFLDGRPRGYKTFSCSIQLSTKFQLLIKTKILKNKKKFHAFSLSNVVFIMLINVKMPKIVGILTKVLYSQGQANYCKFGNFR